MERSGRILRHEPSQNGRRRGCVLELANASPPGSAQNAADSADSAREAAAGAGRAYCRISRGRVCRSYRTRRPSPTAVTHTAGLHGICCCSEGSGGAPPCRWAWSPCPRAAHNRPTRRGQSLAGRGGRWLAWRLRGSLAAHGVSCPDLGRGRGVQTSRPVSRILSRSRRTGGDHPSGAVVSDDLGAVYPQARTGRPRTPAQEAPRSRPS